MFLRTDIGISVQQAFSDPLYSTTHIAIYISQFQEFLSLVHS